MDTTGIAFFKAALENENIQKYVATFWELYDLERAAERLPEIDHGNPHTSTLVFALAGYPFSVRTGLSEMQNDLDGVIEKLSNGTVQSPWMP